MATIEERAKEYAKGRRYTLTVYEAYRAGATEQKDIDDERITKFEKEKALLILEVHNKSKRIAELKAMEE